MEEKPRQRGQISTTTTTATATTTKSKQFAAAAWNQDGYSFTE